MNEILISFEARESSKSAILINQLLDDTSKTDVINQNLHCLLLDKIKTSLSFHTNPTKSMIPGWFYYRNSIMINIIFGRFKKAIIFCFNFKCFGTYEVILRLLNYNIVQPVKYSIYDDFVEFLLSLVKPPPEFTLELIGKIASKMQEKFCKICQSF